MNEKELQDIEFEYAPFTDEGSQQVKALVAEVRRLNEENNRLRADMQSALRGLNEWGEYMCAKILANSLKGGAQ